MGFREFLFLRQSACLRYQLYSLWVQLLASVPRIPYRDKSLIILIFHFALCERNILTLAFKLPFPRSTTGNPRTKHKLVIFIEANGGSVECNCKIGKNRKCSQRRPYLFPNFISTHGLLNIARESFTLLQDRLKC